MLCDYDLNGNSMEEKAPRRGGGGGEWCIKQQHLIQAAQISKSKKDD